MVIDTMDELCSTKVISNNIEENNDQSVEKDENNSSDSLLEIRLNESVRKSELTSLDIRSLVVRCSSCGSQINHQARKEVKKHRKLGVIQCKDCYVFYGSSEFSQDESGYNYCTWCGNGGKLIVCDFCPNGFCSACIRRNFGRSEISITKKEGWECYCCNRKRLKQKVRFCNLIMNYDKLLVKKEKKTPVAVINNKNTLSEMWLQAVFNNTENSCKMFHKKLKKLKAIEMSKSKSLKQVVKKMEEVINNHKSDLKEIVKNLSAQYSSYVDMQKKAVQERLVDNNTNDDPVIRDRNIKECNNIDSNSNQGDCIIIEDIPEKHSPDVNIENESPSILEEIKVDAIQIVIDEDENVQAGSSHVDEKIKAKLSLLQSSSDSDVDSDKTPKVHDTDVEIVSNDSDFKTKRKLNLDSDFKSSSESSDDSLQKCSKSKRKPSKTFLNEDSLSQPEKANFTIENDPKLQLIPCVYMVPCDSLLKEGETFVKVDVQEGEDEEANLEKLIDSLCKFPRKKRRNVARRTPIKRHNVKVLKSVVEEASSSISLSSDDEQDKNHSLFSNSKSTKEANMISKAELMNSDSSSISSASEIEEEEEPVPKKSKNAKKKETDSSDDFQPRKRRKYDKLLHGSLLSDEDKTQKSKKEKRTKKKIMSSEEDGKPNKSISRNTSSTSESDEELRKKANKKRKRIKKIDESSSEEDRGKANEDTPGKGRKNIKRIISQKNLENATKEAQLEEKERKRRIEERQKLYNKIVETAMDGKEIITRKMVLEVDQDSKEEIVEIHPELVCKLKPHQVNGVKFMWECTIESIKDLNKPGSGCILAHCMGLGKTLQVIAFLHTCLNNKYVSKVIKRGMVICPVNTALNWASEFNFWLQEIEGEITVHQLISCKSNMERLDVLKYWYEEGGVIIVSYDIFRNLAAEKISKLRVKERTAAHTYILDPGPDIVICDEGHLLKNEKSAVSKATSKLRTRRRIVLTGTPLQNNLKEYHCMLSFVKPNLLGTSKEFTNRFVNPIINGQYDDSTMYDVKLMKKRIHILHKLLDGCVQRCDYSALTKFLPPKHEFVISVKLSDVQVKMYEYYLEKLTNLRKDNKTVGSTLFVDFNNLRCIWNHPYMCHVSHKRAEYKALFKDDPEEDFINDETESSESSKEANSGEESEEEVIKKYKTRSKANDASDDDIEEIQEVKQWYHEFISEEDKSNIELSGKMVLLVDILKECEAIGDKIIVFSQSLLALDAIEDILHYCDTQPVAETDKDRDVIGSWVKGIDYFRMDGTTSADFRKSYIDMFNNPKNDRARVFLISTRAGSLGTNLVGANRVVVFDTSWNPSHDVQAIFRVYRFGQIKPVYIYRLLAQGTMEEKIYDRQVTKLSLSCRVVDEQQIDRHFSAADLAELYQFDRNSTTNRPTPMVPKDRLLAELLIKKKDWIVTYHEHDSLLQSQTEEDLTEEERQAAWQEYENEREGRAQPLPTPGAAFDPDMNMFGKEPDFTSVDYDERMIPDLKTIVEKLFDNLKNQCPGQVHTLDFKKKLLVSVYKVRQFYQEKHVKVLRMKQELISCGNVPNTINKYLDELSQVLKSTGDYISRLQLNITQEEMKANKNQATFQEQIKRMNPNDPSHIFVMRMQNPQQRGSTLGQQRMAPNMAAFFNQRFPRAMFNNARMAYNRSNPSTARAPTVVEADDNTPAPEPLSSTTTSNKSSTVIIEEIA